MREDLNFDLDAALAGLARDVREASPDPDEALRSRVLADAAMVAGSVAVPMPSRPVPRAPRGWFHGWALGTVAALTASLALGIVMGLTVEVAADAEGERAFMALDDADPFMDIDNG